MTFIFFVRLFSFNACSVGFKKRGLDHFNFEKITYFAMQLSQLFKKTHIAFEI